MPRQALCVCKYFSRVRWRPVAYPGVACVEEQAGMFSATCVSGGLISAGEIKCSHLVQDRQESVESLPKSHGDGAIK